MHIYSLVTSVEDCAKSNTGKSEQGECRLEQQQDGSVLVHYSNPEGNIKTIKAGLVMFGTGRKPSVDNMGLEVGTLQLSHGAIPSLRMIWSIPACFIATSA